MEPACKNGDGGAQWFNPALLGVGLHFAWVYLLYYSLDAGQSALEALPFGTAQSVFWGSGLFLALALCAFLLMTDRALAISERRAARFATPAAVCTGTLLSFCIVNRVFPNAAAPMLVTASILTGVGSATLACRWANVMAHERIGVILLHSLPVVACVVAIVEAASYLPDAAQVALTTALPALTAAALGQARQAQGGGTARGAGQEQHPHRPEQAGATGASRSFSLLLYTCVFVLGCIPAYITAKPSASPIPFDAVFCMAAAFGIFLLICIYLGLFHSKRLPVAAVLPLGIIVCVFIPSAAQPATSPLAAFLPLGYICLEALLFLLALVSAKKAGASPIRTYAACRIVYVASDIVGYGLGTSLAFDVQTELMIEVSLVIVGCIFVLLSAVLLFLTSSSGYFMRRGSSAGLDEAHATSNGARKATKPGTGSDPMTFVKLYKLTPREAEVLECLIKGHSQQRIQEELCVSKGTASFHIQNIYAKCSVHSRQELIALYEQAESGH